MEIVCREVIYRLRKITFLQAQSRVCLSFLQNQWWLEAMVHQIFGQSVKIHDIPIKQWRFAKLFVSLNLRIISWNQFYSNILYYRSFFHGNFSINPWIMVHDTRILWYPQCTVTHCGKMKKYSQHTVEEWKIHSYQNLFPSNQLFSNLLSKYVGFTKFLSKKRESNFP